MALNEYDDLLEGGSDQPENPYDKLARQPAIDQGAALRQSVKTAAKTTPDQAADVAKIAATSKLPTELVQRAYQPMKAQAEQDATPYDAIIAQTPKTASWLTQRNNAAVASDDHGALGALEYLVALPSRALAQSYFQTKSAELQFKTFLGPLSREEQDQKNTYDYFAGDGSGLKTDGAWYQNFITKGMQFAAGLIVPAAQDTAIGAMTGAGVGAAQGAFAGPEAILPAALARGAYGASVGFQAGLARTAFISSAGAALHEYRDLPDMFGHPIDPDVAKMTALGVGAFNAGLMLGGGKIAGAAVESAAGKVAGLWTRDMVTAALRQPTVVAALKDLAVTTAKSTTEMALFGAGAEAASILGHAIAKVASGQPGEQITSGEAATQIAQAAADSAQGSVLTMAALPAAGMAFDAMRANRAASAPAFFSALGEGVAQSKTAKRMPEAMRDFLEQATKDGPVATVYAPTDTWNTYWQSKGVDPAEVAARVTGSKDAYEQATATGADLAIPTARYAETIAGTEHNAFFANELKLGPDEMNGRERDEFLERAKTMAAEPVADEPAYLSQLEERLKAGGVPDAQAKLYAMLPQKFLEIGGERSQLDGFLKSIGLDVNVEGSPTEEAHPAGGTAAAEVPDQSRLIDADPALYTGTERRTATDATFDGEERRLTMPTGKPASVSDAEWEELQGRAAKANASAKAILATRDAATAEARATAQREARGKVDNKVNPSDNPEGYFNVAGTNRATGEGPGSTNAEGQQSQADEGRTVEGGSHVGGAEPRRAPAGIPELGEIYAKRPSEETAARITPEVRQELERIKDELSTFPYVGRTWTFIEHGPKTGNAAGGAADIVAGNAGAPVYQDIQAHSPMNRNAKGEAADMAHGTRAKVEAAVDAVLKNGDVKTNLQEGALRVAENRAAGIWKDLSPAMLPPSWGREVSPEFVDTLSEAVDAGAAENANLLDADAFTHEDAILDPEADVDTSFNVNEFNQSLFEDMESPDPEVDTLTAKTPEVLPADYIPKGGIEVIIQPHQRPKSEARLVAQANALIDEMYPPGSEEREEYDALQAATSDRNEFGEEQARLPGAGDVRDANVQTPEVADAPFALTSEIAKPRTKKQQTLFQSAPAELTRENVAAWAQEVQARVGKDLSDFNVHLSDTGDLLLMGLSVARGAQRAGLGTAVMQELTRFADLNGRSIELTPASGGYDGSTTSKSRLVKFYERFGFQQDGLIMRREPTLPNAIEETPHPAGGTDEGGTLEQPKRGAIRFGPDRQFTVSLLERADPSTFLHEMGHFFLEVMGDMADKLKTQDPALLNDKQQGVIADYDGLLKHLGVASRDQIAEAHHEEFARTFEAYLREGKAPSLEMRGAFARFRAWLLGVYGSLKQLNVRLTPEVTGILDRMLTSDDAIKNAEALGRMEPMFLTPEAAGMSPESFELYRKDIANASREARETLDRKLLADVQREQTATWKAQRAEIKGQVEQETHERPEYLALSAIKDGTRPDGEPLTDMPEPLRLSRQILDERFGKDRAKRLPRGTVTSDGGHDPDVLAPLFGYKSGEEILKAIEDAPAMKAVIEQTTKQRMFEKNGNMLLDGTIYEKAAAAAANDTRDRVLRDELRALAQKQREVRPFVKADAAQQLAERAYERRWLEAEAKLRIAIAEGHKQVEIDALQQQVSDLKAKARGGAVVIRGAMPKAEDVKAFATARIGALQVGSIQPEAFWATARRAARIAIDKAATQDFESAITAKQQEIVNYALFKEATAAKEEIQAAIQTFQKLNRPDSQIVETRNLDFVNAARAVVAQIGLGSRPAEKVDVYLQQLKRYDPSAYEQVAQMIDNALPAEKDYRLMSVVDFRATSTAVAALWELARTTEQIEVNGERKRLSDVRSQVLEQIHRFSEPGQMAGYKRAVSTWDRMKVGLMGLRARGRRVEDWVTAVDNGREGIARQSIYDPINNGAVRYDTEKQKYAERHAIAVQQMDGTLPRGQIDAREIGYVFADKQELLGALLHVGNGFLPGSNGDKLLRGRNWGLQGPDRNVDTRRWDAFIDRMHSEGVLKKSDYDFAQAVWDMAESTKPEAQRAYKERFGRYFDEVTAVGFDTPFGHYAGGYYPAKADPFITPEVGERDAMNLEDDGATMFPSVGSGWGQTRVNGYAKPLILDASQVLSHVNAVLRFTYLSKPVHDVARLVLHPTFRAGMDPVDPAVVTDLLKPYLQRAASQTMYTRMEGKGGQAADAIAREIRTRGAMQIIALSGTVIAEQLTHLPAVLVHPDIDATRLLGAMWQLSRGPKTMIADIHDASAYMATRSETGLSDAHAAIDRILLDQNPAALAAGWVRDHTTVIMRGIQTAMDAATWQSVYDKVAAEPDTTHDQAVLRADSAVRQSLGSYRPQDRSAIEGGNQVGALLNQFYGFFNAKANMLGTEAVLASRMGLQRKFSRGFAAYTLGLMVPAMLGEGIKNVIAGQSPIGKSEDGDDEAMTFLRFWGLSQLKMGARMVPFGGAAMETAIQAFNKGKPIDLLSAPSIAMVENVLHAPGEAYKALTDTNARTHAQNAKAITDFFTMLGVMSNLPMRPIGTAVNVAHDALTKQ